MRFFSCIALLAAALIAPCAAQDDPVSDAVAALQQSDFASAERILRAELARHPANPAALDVLGVVLDQEKKYSEADAVYRRALTAAPNSASILNNYANHLIATGKQKEARALFLRVLAMNPQNVNACVQVARLALQEKVPAETACLGHLPATAQQNRDVQMLEMQAAYAQGHTAEANRLLASLSPAASADPHAAFALAIALAEVRQYGDAETYFAHTVEAAPDNFQALYDLGLAASHAGHKERAEIVLKKALERQPENVDVLYDLAAVEAELGHTDTALELLAHAEQIAPDRADIQRLLAHTSAEIGDFADAVEAWKRYMTLAPADDVGRREHAFAETALDEHSTAGLSDLRWYAARHPSDPLGHYELGTAESAINTAEALRELNRALTLKPDLTAAHMARGLLNYRLAQYPAALADFEFASQREPTNARVFDRLGETYAALNRPADALRSFRQAAKLAPDDSAILLHLGRALQTAGETEEAKVAFARFRELGPNRSALPHPAGLVEFLKLTPEQQFARYRAGVERTVEKDPANAEAQVRSLELLVADHNTQKAAATADKILSLKPSAALLADAANALVGAEQYALAANFIDEAIKQAPGQTAPDLKLDLALVTFHQGGAQAGLEKLSDLPPDARNGNYDLARMQMLEALGKSSDADRAFNQALQAKPSRPELYRQVALALLQKNRISDAIRLLELGARVLPDDTTLPALRETAAEIQAHPEQAAQLLRPYADRVM